MLHSIDAFLCYLIYFASGASPFFTVMVMTLAVLQTIFFALQLAHLLLQATFLSALLHDLLLEILFLRIVAKLTAIAILLLPLMVSNHMFSNQTCQHNAPTQ